MHIKLLQIVYFELCRYDLRIYIYLFCSLLSIPLMLECAYTSILSATMYRNSVSHGCIQSHYIYTTNNPSRSLTSQQRLNN